MSRSDYALGASIELLFNTMPDGVTPTTLAGSPVLKVWKGGNSTEQTLTGVGGSLTVDYDGVTGLHKVTIDTSNTDVDGFWAVNSEYTVIFTAGTCGGKSMVGVIVGGFSIEKQFALADIRKIAGDADSPANLAGQYSGVGITGDTFPATQAQVAAIPTTTEWEAGTIEMSVAFLHLDGDDLNTVLGTISDQTDQESLSAAVDASTAATQVASLFDGKGSFRVNNVILAPATDIPPIQIVMKSGGSAKAIEFIDALSVSHDAMWWIEQAYGEAAAAAAKPDPLTAEQTADAVDASNTATTVATNLDLKVSDVAGGGDAPDVKIVDEVVRIEG